MLRGLTWKKKGSLRALSTVSFVGMGAMLGLTACDGKETTNASNQEISEISADGDVPRKTEASVSVHTSEASAGKAQKKGAAPEVPVANMTPRVEEVSLTPELEQEYGAENARLAELLSSADLAEIKKVELLWDASPAKLHEKLAALEKAAEAGGAVDVNDVFPRACVFDGSLAKDCFIPEFSYSDEPILYADDHYIITRRNGVSHNSSVYTFWDAATCRQCKSISLPGAVYCPSATNVPGVYQFEMLRSRERSGDYLTPHMKPCIAAYFCPESGNFASVYADADGIRVPITKTIGSPRSVFPKLVTETPCYVSALADELERAAGDEAARAAAIKTYQDLKQRYLFDGGLSYLHKSPYLFAPLKMENTVTHRLPMPRNLYLGGDISGKTASLAASDGGPGYMVLDLETLSKKTVFQSKGRISALSFNSKGEVTPKTDGRGEQVSTILKGKLHPYPSRYNSSLSKEESLDHVRTAQLEDGSTAFVCSTGNCAWQVFDGGSVNELLGVMAPNGQCFLLNPFEQPLNCTTKLTEYKDVVNGGSANNIQGGSPLILLSGKYRLLEMHNIGIRRCELIICKQTAQNKEEILRVHLNLAAKNYTVITHTESPVYRLSPLWIARRQWFLKPESDYRYSIHEWGKDGSDKTIADLYLEPTSGTYAVVLPDGRYAGSPGCERLMSVQDAHGNSMSMAAYAMWRNRPGEVLEALGGNPDDVAALKQTTQRWLKKLLAKKGKSAEDLGEEPAMESFPRVQVGKVALHTQQDYVMVPVHLEARETAVNRLSVMADGVEVLQDGAESGSVPAGGKLDKEIKVPLIAGQNWIEVTAYDENDLQSNTERFRVVSDREQKSDLYVVALGVSKYQEEDLQLQYAAKDATDMADNLQKFGQGQEKHILLLTDEKVNKDTVLEEISAFLRSSEPGDRVILYCAGHGLLDAELRYHYAPVGINPDNIEQTGIPMDDLVECLNSAPARRRLLLLDTCHAGALGEAGEDQLAASGVPLPGGVTEVKTRGMKVKQVPQVAALNVNVKKRYIEDMFSMGNQYRGVNIVAASAGAEFAQESGEWKNGIFTSSVIKALRRDAAVDQNADGILSVEELQQYLSGIVPEMTGGTQAPSVVSAEDSGSFSLSVDLAYFVRTQDWEGLQIAAETGFRVNEGVYPDDETALFNALEQKAPETALETLLRHGAELMRPRRVPTKGDIVTIEEQRPADLINADNAYTDFDMKKVDYCRKLGYPILKLRRLIRRYAQQNTSSKP